mmetsp:Transcript_55879/g.155814  ORF Transcript_55879/g.155814 Transcript_55879/m.155814 type:complete len:203 (-) Transcript_55879:1384-1992(-)
MLIAAFFSHTLTSGLLPFHSCGTTAELRQGQGQGLLVVCISSALDVLHGRGQRIILARKEALRVSTHKLIDNRVELQVAHLHAVSLGQVNNRRTQQRGPVVPRPHHRQARVADNGHLAAYERARPPLRAGQRGDGLRAPQGRRDGVGVRDVRETSKLRPSAGETPRMVDLSRCPFFNLAFERTQQRLNAVLVGPRFEFICRC